MSALPEIAVGPAARSLAGVALFADLPEAARRQIERACRWRSYDAEQTIVAHDYPGSDVYFLVAGRARVVLYSAAGREVSCDKVGPGACVGELAAMDGGTRSADIVALAPSLVAILPRAAESKAASALHTPLAAALRQATGRIFELSMLGAHNRVYAQLLRLAGPTAGGRTGASSSARSPHTAKLRHAFRPRARRWRALFPTLPRRASSRAKSRSSSCATPNASRRWSEASAKREA